MNINIKQLNKELHYHPPWLKDRPVFIRLLNQSHFTNTDIILFARLYIKYSHIHCFQVSELTKYFKSMLVKMKIHNSEKLFCKTQVIYNQLQT